MAQVKIIVSRSLDDNFESETDRRDYLRGETIDQCIRAVDEVIEALAPTKTAQERAYLEMAVVKRILNRHTMAAHQALWVEEIKEAEAKIDAPPSL